MGINKTWYFFTLVLLVLFSYGFVDFSIPFTVPFHFNELVYAMRMNATVGYVILITILFFCYGRFVWFVEKKKIAVRSLVTIIFLTSAILLFSYPAFSNDIYNYIATAKVTYLYGENPYVVMPIEISKESMLPFLHAANKTALYGPSWILLSFIPHVLGMGNLVATVFTFKLFISVFYLLTAYLVWKLSEKHLWSVAAYSLNPLIIIESLVSAHNDIVMIFFALYGFYLMKKRHLFMGGLSLIVSIGIKYATVVLIPVYVYLLIQHYRGKKVDWSRIWFVSGMLMLIPFLVSPFREEMYSWYFQWVIVFIALSRRKGLFVLSFVFSCALLLRFAPYIYIRNWDVRVAHIKLLVTTIPITLAAILYGILQLTRYKKKI